MKTTTNGTQSTLESNTTQKMKANAKLTPEQVKIVTNIASELFDKPVVSSSTTIAQVAKDLPTVYAAGLVPQIVMFGSDSIETNIEVNYQWQCWMDIEPCLTIGESFEWNYADDPQLNPSIIYLSPTEIGVLYLPTAIFYLKNMKTGVARWCRLD
tara:strand:+ start:324 stop:788 length:465 start_codon:yes stop_codon:yes gene_type:complete